MIVAGVSITSNAGIFQGKQPYLQTVTRTQVQQDIHSGQSEILYIGRETCPYCREFKPKLEKFIVQYHLQIKYFDTTHKNEALLEDREVYHSLGVNTVPSIVILSHGHVSKIFEATTQWQQIQNYLIQGE